MHLPSPQRVSSWSETITAGETGERKKSGLLFRARVKGMYSFPYHLEPVVMLREWVLVIAQWLLMLMSEILKRSFTVAANENEVTRSLCHKPLRKMLIIFRKYICKARIITPFDTLKL